LESNPEGQLVAIQSMPTEGDGLDDFAVKVIPGEENWLDGTANRQEQGYIECERRIFRGQKTQKRDQVTLDR
jgi:hypothetical protein